MVAQADRENSIMPDACRIEGGCASVQVTRFKVLVLRTAKSRLSVRRAVAAPAGPGPGYN